MNTDAKISRGTLGRMLGEMAETLETRGRSVAEDLRRLAASIDRRCDDALHPSFRDMETLRLVAEPFDLAERIQHEVLWGVANLHLDGLLRAASDVADVRRRILQADAVDAALAESGS